MLRAVLCLGLVACGSSKQPAPATPVAPAPPPAEPATPQPVTLDAQAKLALWLDAFNAGDLPKLVEFHTKHMTPALAKDFPADAGLLGFRESIGGFDLKKTELTTPAKFVAIAKEREGDRFARIVIEVDASNTVSTLDIKLVPTPDEFKPAKMTSTSSPFEDGKPIANRSIAYTKASRKWTDAKDTLPIRATSAGGGDSTVGDLLKFANALQANKLLDKKHTELLLARKTAEDAGGYAYGFGTAKEDGVTCFGHGGGAPGMNGMLSICDSAYTIAVLANIDPPAAMRVMSFIKARLPKQ